MKLKHLNEAKPGDRVEFVYDGGSNPGTSRTIIVQRVLSDRIWGLDVAKNEHRQYLFDRVNSESCVAILTPAVQKTRTKSTVLSFIDARSKLHDQIDSLTGEDLAEALAIMSGEDRGTFDTANSQVIIERDVAMPHCRVNNEYKYDGVTVPALEYINEDGEVLTTATIHDIDKDEVFLIIDESLYGAEIFIEIIAKHLGILEKIA